MHLSSFPGTRDFFWGGGAHSSVDNCTFHIDIKNTYKPSK